MEATFEMTSQNTSDWLSRDIGMSEGDAPFPWQGAVPLPLHDWYGRPPARHPDGAREDGSSRNLVDRTSQLHLTARGTNVSDRDGWSPRSHGLAEPAGYTMTQAGEILPSRLRAIGASSATRDRRANARWRWRWS
jgi:hypothetical protein